MSSGGRQRGGQQRGGLLQKRRYGLLTDNYVAVLRTDSFLLCVCKCFHFNSLLHFLSSSTRRSLHHPFGSDHNSWCAT